MYLHLHLVNFPGSSAPDQGAPAFCIRAGIHGLAFYAERWQNMVVKSKHLGVRRGSER